MQTFNIHTLRAGRIVKVLFLFFCGYRLSAQPGFVSNTGQVHDQNGVYNKEVLFVNVSPEFKIALRSNGYSYEILRRKTADAFTPFRIANRQNDSVTIQRIDIDFMNSGLTEVIASGKSDHIINFYSDDTVLNDIAAYKKVLYKDVFRHIDIEFLSESEKSLAFKYNIYLKPGAKIADIAFKISGAEASLENNVLILKTGAGEIHESVPVSFYAEDKLTIVKVDYVLQNGILKFKSDEKIKKLFVIDPLCNLLWGTYMGGPSAEGAMCMGSDSLGNIYHSGYTSSSLGMFTSGAYQTTIAGGTDVYLSKFSPAGQRIWSTYYGGAGTDIVYAMATLPDGTSYLAGATSSTAGIASSGAQQAAYGGGINDAMLIRFNAAGQRVWATYYGGEGHDIAQAITVDRSGNVFIAGHTESTVNIATAGAYKTVYNFNYDVCVAKYNSSGAMQWGTYYGDSGVDEAYAMAADSAGNVVVTGGTQSISDISTPASFQPNNAGALDAFITKIKSDGSALIWGTYYGGTGNDMATAMKIDRQGLIYVGGSTGSPAGLSSIGCYQFGPGSPDDAFVALFSKNGQRLWGTYFGGNDPDYINDLVLDSKNNILLTGSTSSTNNISSPGAWQYTLNTNGFYDAFFARFSQGGALQLSTYYGGESNDAAKGITIDRSGKIYIAGETTSTTNISTPGSHQPQSSNSSEVLLAKFCIPFTPLLYPAAGGTFCPGTIVLSSEPGYASYLWSNGIKTNPLVLSIQASGNYYFSLQVSDGTDCGGKSDTIRVIVSKCLGVEEITSGNSLKLFPVPAGDFLTINGPAELLPGIYKIYSADGKLQREGILIESAIINVAELGAGIYLIVFENSQGTRGSAKFVK